MSVCHLVSDPEPVRGCDKIKQMNAGFRNVFDIYAVYEPGLLIAEGDPVAHRETVQRKVRFSQVPVPMNAGSHRHSGRR